MSASDRYLERCRQKQLAQPKPKPKPVSQPTLFDNAPLPTAKSESISVEDYIYRNVPPFDEAELTQREREALERVRKG